jgi:DNA-binding MurR/RpiR family transcriptional regulator
VSHARSLQVPIIAITDSPIAEIAVDAACVLTVHTEGPGPFDSLVGMLAVTNVLAAHAVSRRGTAATTHLDRLEATWTELGTLTTE